MTSVNVQERIATRVVGRERELELAFAAIDAGRDLVLEGPPGTSKTTMLRAITAEWGIPLVLIEGNGDLTPSKLIGYHSPARVLSEGYTVEGFVAGPLVEAMQRGGFLYIEEFNRAPEDTLNVLLTAMADRQIEVPRFGTVSAEPTFRVIASMNPFDNIGTTRISTSISDRLNRIVVDYQDADAEVDIVRLRTGIDCAGSRDIVIDAVAVARMTREHPDIVQGTSIRGAIDLALIADRLISSRNVFGRADDESAIAYRDTMLAAMNVALSGRISIDAASERAPEAVLGEIWEQYFILGPAAADPG